VPGVARLRAPRSPGVVTTGGVGALWVAPAASAPRRGPQRYRSHQGRTGGAARGGGGLASPARSAVHANHDAAPRAPMRGADAGPLPGRVGCRGCADDLVGTPCRARLLFSFSEKRKRTVAGRGARWRVSTRARAPPRRRHSCRPARRRVVRRAAHADGATGGNKHGRPRPREHPGRVHVASRRPGRPGCCCIPLPSCWQRSGASH